MKRIKIAVIGLGYVGLPLAVEFAKKYKVVGFDVNAERVEELRKGIDGTLEITNEQLSGVLVENAKELVNNNIGLLPSSDVYQLGCCFRYILGQDDSGRFEHQPEKIRCERLEKIITAREKVEQPEALRSYFEYFEEEIPYWKIKLALYLGEN